jgi:hypothetical protein
MPEGALLNANMFAGLWAIYLFILIGFPIAFVASHLLVRFLILRPIYARKNDKLRWQFTISDYLCLVALLGPTFLLEIPTFVTGLAAIIFFMWWSTTGAVSRARITNPGTRTLMLLIVAPLAHAAPIAVVAGWLTTHRMAAAVVGPAVCISCYLISKWAVIENDLPPVE